MKRVLSLLALSLLFILPSCKSVVIAPGEEAALVKQPYIFGSDGVDEEVLTQGRHYLALSSSAYVYNVKPVKYEESFDDVITADNNPVDFTSYIQIEIEKGKCNNLHQSKGKDWYKENIMDQFRAKIRGYCSKYPMFVLTTDRTIVDSLELIIKQEMIDYVTEENINILIKQVIIGKVTPPQSVIQQTHKTAAQEQAKKTENARGEREDARKIADEKKAVADLAYKNKFGMTTDQYLRLRELEIEKEKIEMIKNKKNVTIIMNQGGGGLPATLPVR